jgi:hypothetical protein
VTVPTPVTATRILFLLLSLFLSHEKRNKQIAVSGVSMRQFSMGLLPASTTMTRMVHG